MKVRCADGSFEEVDFEELEAAESILDRQQVDLLEGLNESQKRVVEFQDGVLQVLAVAGAGKTRVLVHRVARLVREGQDPKRILAVTFTKKAAEEMNDRLESLGCSTARIGTFHSVCLEVLREGGPWKEHEVDDGNKMAIALKEIIGYRGMNWRDADLTLIEQQIGRWKNDLVMPETAAQDRTVYDGRYAEAYFRFEEERERRMLISFDDMLYLCGRRFEMDPDAADRWAHRYDHVLVDEFQDSNRAQYEFMRIVAKHSKSLMIVADDDQLIYSWRGSRPEYTLNFLAEYPGATLIRMEDNYRSVPGILEAANRCIAFNAARVPKINRAVRPAGAENPVRVSFASDMDDEANRVADRIGELRAEGMAWKDFVVTYRTNAQSRAFEEAFIARKWPHRVVGGTVFYLRKEVADLLSYLRLLRDPADDKAFSRAVNRPFRFVGKASVDRICEAAKEQRVTCLDAARSGEVHGLQRRTADSVREFCALFEDLRDMNQKDVPGLITRVLERTRYLEWLARDEGTDSPENSRVSNVKELVRTANRFQSVETMLDYVDEMIRASKRKKDEERADVILLMSGHKCKGLEWPVVFLAGCCEGILPHARSENIEEERRLFYVMVTRARDQLFVTVPTGAYFGGAVRDMTASRFLGEAGIAPSPAQMIVDVQPMKKESDEKKPEVTFMDSKEFCQHNFPLGHLVMTCGVQAEMESRGAAFAQWICASIMRHTLRDWGDLDPEDKAANDRALVDGDRLLSAYVHPEHGKVWIITEHDRSVTTVLLPEEY